MQIHCAYDKIKAIKTLKANPENPNVHPQKQVELLAEIMAYQGVREAIVVSKRSGLVTRGHGKLMAAKLNGWTRFPVDLQDYDDEEQEYADMVADNEIARLAKTDDAMVRAKLLALPNLQVKLLAMPRLRLEKKSIAGERSKSKLVHKCPNCGHSFSASKSNEDL